VLPGSPAVARQGEQLLVTTSSTSQHQPQTAQVSLQNGPCSCTLQQNSWHQAAWEPGLIHKSEKATSGCHCCNQIHEATDNIQWTLTTKHGVQICRLLAAADLHCLAALLQHRHPKHTCMPISMPIFERQRVQPHRHAGKLTTIRQLLIPVMYIAYHTSMLAGS
jgi:hypothetical protein